MPLYVVGTLLFVQFVVIVTRPADTVSSLGRVLPSIMQGIEQIFILLTVFAVVSLGVYLSLRQFALWEAGQRKLLDMAERLTGGDGSPEARSDAPPLSSAGLSVLVISIGFLDLFIHWAAVAAVR